MVRLPGGYRRISITSISAFLSIIFPLGPPFCGDECRAERALGCGGIFPWPAGRCDGSGGGKEMRGRRSERLGSRVGTRYKPAIRR